MTCCHSNSSGGPSANTGKKNSQRSKIINKNKENLLNCGHCHFGRSRSENKENEKRDKYLHLARELQKYGT